jgi:NAD+ diphosphatase
MLSVPASRPNAYTGSPLDRAGTRRDDADWITRALSDPESLFAPVWRSRSLMKGSEDGHPEAVLLTGATAEAVRMAGGPWAFLGLWAGRPVFAVDCSAAEDPLPLLPDGMGGFTDLRQVAGLLPPGEASVLAHARGLMHWRTRHSFCGVCGHACAPRSAGNAMQCTNCNAQHFPRTDPAVIMLVVRQGRCLLGHSHRFPNTAMYSTLAGFVEPGREPGGGGAPRGEGGDGRRGRRGALPLLPALALPLLHHARLPREGLTDEIRIDPEELKDARWFTRDQLRDPGRAWLRPAARGFHRAPPDRGLDARRMMRALAVTALPARARRLRRPPAAPVAQAEGPVQAECREEARQTPAPAICPAHGHRPVVAAGGDRGAARRRRTRALPTACAAAACCAAAGSRQSTARPASDPMVNPPAFRPLEPVGFLDALETAPSRLGARPADPAAVAVVRLMRGLDVLAECPATLGGTTACPASACSRGSGSRCT